MQNIEQTSDEYLNWQIDWSKRGLGLETISTSVWAASSPDVLIDQETNTTTTTKMYLTGGVAGNIYTITNTIETSGGLTMQETIPYICIAPRFA